ncbi:hypothetical protein [Sphingobacterium lumbrici]|uniref:hypothetical protein n=1 Tax=Sphingobacterium lumbrici TaxID=2559600 RepID=UPI00112A5CFE|nr:hypothetical protein [Sphingobacterium lumbrici]
MSCATSTAVWQYGGLKYFYETFVQGSTVVIFFNFSAKNPPHRQAANRKKKVVEAKKSNEGTISE